MDEYPEYDFYNSREECDGKEGWEGRGDGREDGKKHKERRLTDESTDRGKEKKERW